MIFVYDLTRKSTFDKLEFWKDEVRNFADEDVIVSLVGNKSDMADQRQVKQEEGEAMVRKNNFSFFFELSAKEDPNQLVEKLFEALAERLLSKRRSLERSGKTLKNSKIAKKEVDKNNVSLHKPPGVKKAESCGCLP